MNTRITTSYKPSLAPTTHTYNGCNHCSQLKVPESQTTSKRLTYINHRKADWMGFAEHLDGHFGALHGRCNFDVLTQELAMLLRYRYFCMEKNDYFGTTWTAIMYGNTGARNRL